MKCSSRRNCDVAGACRTGWLTTGLNEVQFPKELRRRLGSLQQRSGDASMKCSSRRNCDSHVRSVSLGLLAASMKCSSRGNCDTPTARSDATAPSLNEVQFPKELRRPAQYSPPPRTSEETSRALHARTPTQPHHSSPNLTESPLFQRSTAASTARGSSSTAALASSDKRPLWRDRPGQADIGESLFIN